MKKNYYQSPIGCLKITASEKGLKLIEFSDFEDGVNDNSPILDEVVLQLDEYFTGKRKYFDVKTDIAGTEFQRKVWNAISYIQSGRVKSYKDLAGEVVNPKASRAIGMACNKNPLPIIVPCHRVVGSNGKLTGYAGGIDKKQWLLDFENGV